MSQVWTALCPTARLVVVAACLALQSPCPFTPAKGNTVESTHSRAGWLNVVGGIGAIAVPLAILFSFFTADDDYEDTAAGLIGYAKGHESDIWLQQIVALAAPLLIGFFLASLWGRLRGSTEAYRVLTVIGGTLFVAFFAVGMTLWSAPLLSADELTDAGAEAYLGSMTSAGSCSPSAESRSAS